MVIGEGESEKNYVAELPLIYHMAYFERFSEKLYFSGIEENWELADIYTHELEEIAEMIAEGDFVDENIDRSKLMEDMFIPQIEEMEKAIDSKDLAAFKERYQILIQTCNSCHDAANYKAVNITIPENNYYHQDFSPMENE